MFILILLLGAPVPLLSVWMRVSPVLVPVTRLVMSWLETIYTTIAMIIPTNACLTMCTCYSRPTASKELTATNTDKQLTMYFSILCSILKSTITRKKVNVKPPPTRPGVVPLSSSVLPKYLLNISLMPPLYEKG